MRHGSSPAARSATTRKTWTPPWTRILAGFGINAPAVEDDFVETIFLPADDGKLVFNLYAPSEWKGEPSVPPGTTMGWFGLEDLEPLQMDAAVRAGILRAFGMGGAAVDDDASILEALGAQPELAPAAPAPAVRPPGIRTPPSRRELGLDVLRTLNADDPAAEANLRGRAGDLADSVLDFALGEVWQGAALDRKARSLLVVAMLASLGRLGPLRGHIRGALNHGATPDQLVETLKMVSVYAGFPAAVEAWPVVMEVFKERGITRDPDL